MPTAEGQDPLDLIRLPELVQDLVHGDWIQSSLMVDECVVAVLVTILTETDYGQDVLDIVGTGHE